MARRRWCRPAALAGLLLAVAPSMLRQRLGCFVGPQRAPAPRPHTMLRAAEASGTQAEEPEPLVSRRKVLDAANVAVGLWLVYKVSRLPSMYIAALGDRQASSGSGAERWGLWRQDPGPRGVQLQNFEKLRANGGVAPAEWQFDASDWWLEEHGLIMEQPSEPLPPGRYTVTGDREVTTTLTVHPAEAGGAQRWELAEGRLYDVTHLPCRSARYTPAERGEGSCSPAFAERAAFPVEPGAPMPPVVGCRKQDYAVLFVLKYEA